MMDIVPSRPDVLNAELLMHQVCVCVMSCKDFKETFGILQ